MTSVDPAAVRAATVAPPSSSAASAAEVPAVAPATRTRGRRPSTLLGIRTELAVRWRIVLGILGVASVFALWAFAASRSHGGNVLVPSPARTWHALREMWSTGTLRADLAASAQRVAIGYSISVGLGIVIGIGIGSFASVEAFLEPQLGFLRYIPATALTPLFLLWLGIDESPKIWLIAVGTVFDNVLMIADVARNVPREMLNASYTLGAGRRTILRRVILPHSWPGIIDVARINLAAAWLMLVVAELLAAQKGLAYQINLAQRFRAVDTMFALLIVFGVIGLASDVALRWLRNRVAPWARS
ncbi:MAG: transporter permease [Acidimicrobiales bacterium]|nr:transporter permease [Acidimicrobiales bacterium]